MISSKQVYPHLRRGFLLPYIKQLNRNFIALLIKSISFCPLQSRVRESLFFCPQHQQRALVIRENCSQNQLINPCFISVFGQAAGFIPALQSPRDDFASMKEHNITFWPMLVSRGLCQRPWVLAEIQSTYFQWS